MYRNTNQRGIVAINKAILLSRLAFLKSKASSPSNSFFLKITLKLKEAQRNIAINIDRYKNPTRSKTNNRNNKTVRTEKRKAFLLNLSYFST